MRLGHTGSAILGLVLSSLALSACGDPKAKVPRTVAVDELTFADVQQRVREAVSRPGFVVHSAETRSIAGKTLVTDAWIDLERHVARIDQNGAPYWIFSADKLASLGPTDGRYEEAEYGFPGYDEPLLGFVFDFTQRVLTPDAKNEGMEAAEVTGAPTIKVTLSQEVNSDGNRHTERSTIYFDESFLPLKLELDAGPPYPKSTGTYRNEYLRRDQLAADFFSFDHLKARAKTAEDDLVMAAQVFGSAYWLGDPFESMELKGANTDRPGGEPVLHVDYGDKDVGSSGPDAPFPCASIRGYTQTGWADRQQLVAQNNPNAGNRVLRDTKLALGGEARIYEQPAERVLQPAGIEGQPSPVAPTLAESSTWSAEIMLDDAVVELDISCGPPGRNPYRSLDGVRHLLEALRAFDTR